MRGELDEIRARIGAAGDDEAALRRVARRAARRHGRGPDLSAPLALARKLWAADGAERSVAIGMIAELERFLDGAHWALFKRWTEGCRSRRQADAIAVEILGAIVARDRTFVRVLRHWSRSRDPKIRRAAVLGVLLRTRRMGDAEAALSVCEALMRDRNPGVAEAVERVLRESAEADAEATREFVERWRGPRR
ncbi:MAG: DNA alkylation repair protein [Planctomycetes bacterium]|nr:DNA alkylation repair protein [Planctomycetota bacterium]